MCGDTVCLLSNTIIKQLDIVFKKKKQKNIQVINSYPKTFLNDFS